MLTSPFSLQDKESFSDLFSHTHLIIFRFIYGIHGGPVEEVEDLTSDTFTRAWKNRRKFSGNDQEALRWLFTIARNLVIDDFRKKKSKHDESIHNIEETTLNGLFASEVNQPEEQTTNRESFTQLWKLIQNLPFDRREMLILRYVVGWKVKDIATYLNMEENTVSVYIHRSIEHIRHGWKE